MMTPASVLAMYLLPVGDVLYDFVLLTGRLIQYCIMGLIEFVELMICRCLKNVNEGSRWQAALE